MLISDRMYNMTAVVLAMLAFYKNSCYKRASVYLGPAHFSDNVLPLSQPCLFVKSCKAAFPRSAKVYLSATCVVKSTLRSSLSYRAVSQILSLRYTLTKEDIYEGSFMLLNLIVFIQCTCSSLHLHAYMT